MTWYEIGTAALVTFWIILLLLGLFCGIMEWLANHTERR